MPRQVHFGLSLFRIDFLSQALAQRFFSQSSLMNFRAIRANCWVFWESGRNSGVWLK